eukprot:gene10339-8275_t
MYSLNDLQSYSLLSLCGPGTNVKVMKRLVQSNWVGKATALKILLYKKDGAPFWAYILSCPLSENKGTFSKQTLHIVIDITSSKVRKIGRYIMGKVIGQGAFGLAPKATYQETETETSHSPSPYPSPLMLLLLILSLLSSSFSTFSFYLFVFRILLLLYIVIDIDITSSKHPHIIRLMEIQFVNSVFFLVMEYASGGSLVGYVRKQSKDHRLDEVEARRLFLQTAMAVDYCHRRRIVHRDLKPENILLDDSGNIKIADFGLAAVTAPFSKGLTDQVGTPQFTAPEIINGLEYEGPSVDIWSLGVILYEALTSSSLSVRPNLDHLDPELYPYSSAHAGQPRSVHIPMGCLSQDPALSPLSCEGTDSQHGTPTSRFSRDGGYPEVVHESARIVFNDADDPSRKPSCEATGS